MPLPSPDCRELIDDEINEFVRAVRTPESVIVYRSVIVSEDDEELWPVAECLGRCCHRRALDQQYEDDAMAHRAAVLTVHITYDDCPGNAVPHTCREGRERYAA